MKIPLGWAVALLAAPLAAADDAVDFNRDIRPILSNHCFQCHGPDDKQRQAELRLDTRDGLFAPRDEVATVTPGQPQTSGLWRRIISTDPSERMPPPEANRDLSASQINLLHRWIEQGAAWETHWSFVPPARPGIPSTSTSDGLRGGIDALVQHRLRREKLAPAPSAKRTTLLRRATLDLTGLPPTPDEVATFLADNSPDAYERAVDRLLASPRYGERMAGPWLDAARYADTSGYQSDGPREMWRWRDWVIDALNADMPFDQFTVEQLAGDLLPNATLQQRIATAFNRNHRGNAEGGIIPEEYAVEYVVDRVETTSTVWLGLTMGCARCHSHKYDPLTQHEFYRLFAFFNNVPEKGRAIKIGNSPPFIKSPTRWQQVEWNVHRQKLSVADRAWTKLANDIAAAEHAWLQSPAAAEAKDGPLLAEHIAARMPLIGDTKFDGERVVDAGNRGDFGFFDKFTLSAFVRLPAVGDGGTVLSRMSDSEHGDGYQLAIVGGKLQLNLAKRWLDDACRVETAEPLPAGRWLHVAATYDGSRTAEGIALYVDGERQSQDVLVDELNQTFASKEPLRVGGGGGPGLRFRGEIKEARVESRDLAPDEVRVLAAAPPVAEIVKRSAGERSLNERQKLREHFLQHFAAEEIRQARKRLSTARQTLREFEESLPTTMVMEEMATPRETQILVRGQYDHPGERVVAGVPAALPPLTSAGKVNRLSLARWLVDRANPLPARVTVNRYWQTFFGIGLVKTTEDFGVQGERPPQQEVLDFLATEFLRGGWDVKRLQRAIITSGTYRQSSRATTEALRRDPDNRLLARGPRIRLSAEIVRDQALAASGLLVETLGGPSVKPLQPPGLWKELTGGEDYQPGTGRDLYRRSLYTFWKRTIPPPAMTTFDASSREFCTVAASRTNTPLQALALLNEETFVAAARQLAKRVMREEATPAARIARAFLLVLSRRPSVEESQVLERAWHSHRQHYDADPSCPSAELAAYDAVCATILNLDEAVTKE